MAREFAGQRAGSGAWNRRLPRARNGAFEAYREETMRRLDEESAKFREFLQRLRRSRDKQEFDAFIDGRRGRPAITQGDTA